MASVPPYPTLGCTAASSRSPTHRLSAPSSSAVTAKRARSSCADLPNCGTANPSTTARVVPAYAALPHVVLRRQGQTKVNRGRPGKTTSDVGRWSPRARPGAAALARPGGRHAPAAPAPGPPPPQPSRPAPSEFDPLAQVGVDGGPAGVPDLSATQNTWLLARRPPPRPRVRSLAHPRP